jgi:WW domain binding protein 11
MAKEKSVNPAQAQRKAEKQKALKKGTFNPTTMIHPCEH